MKKATYKHTLWTCCFGYITQAINNNLAPLLFVIFQDSFGISFSMIGRLILINFLTQLVVDIFAVSLADRIGHRLLIVTAHGLAAAGLALLGILPLIMAPYAGLVIAVMLYSSGSGLIEVLVSPIVDSLPGEQKSTAMSLLHSFYSWGQLFVILLSTLFIWAFGPGLWFVLPLLWALVPFGNLFAFARVPLMPAVKQHEKTPLSHLFRAKIYLLALALMMGAGASELSMMQWASLFAEKGLGVSKLLGDLLGPCLFSVFMGMGRLAFGLWGGKINLRRALFASSLLCIACYVTAALSPLPWLSLLACALCGLSISLMWPGMLSLTAARFPKGGTAMFGILAIAGDIGCAIGPFTAGLAADGARAFAPAVSLGTRLGLTADQLGLKAGMLLSAVFPFLMLLGLFLFRKKETAQE